MRLLKGQKGLSLVEVTIMLMVLMLLTSVLAPSILDYVRDAERVKVKEDCEAIGISIARLTMDVGNCLKIQNKQSTGCAKGDRADLLVSRGATPTASTDVNFVNGIGGTNENNDVNWTDAAGLATQVDTLENQLVTNDYFTGAAGAGHYKTYSQTDFLTWPFGVGWRGAYLSAPIGPDPWGNRYMVNSVFLAPVTGVANCSSEEGCYGWTYDVFCVSAGPNGIIQTNFYDAAGHGVTSVAGSDDFYFAFSGSSR